MESSSNSRNICFSRGRETVISVKSPFYKDNIIQISHDTQAKRATFSPKLVQISINRILIRRNSNEIPLFIRRKYRAYLGSLVPQRISCRLAVRSRGSRSVHTKCRRALIVTPNLPATAGIDGPLDRRPSSHAASAPGRSWANRDCVRDWRHHPRRESRSIRGRWRPPRNTASPVAGPRTTSRSCRGRPRARHGAEPAMKSMDSARTHPRQTLGTE